MSIVVSSEIEKVEKYLCFGEFDGLIAYDGSGAVGVRRLRASLGILVDGDDLLVIVLGVFRHD